MVIIGIEVVVEEDVVNGGPVIVGGVVSTVEPEVESGVVPGVVPGVGPAGSPWQAVNTRTAKPIAIERSSKLTVRFT